MILVLLPEQILDDTGVTVSIGTALTVIACVAVMVHVLREPTTVYVVVLVGVAVTVAPVLALSVAAGDQE